MSAIAYSYIIHFYIQTLAPLQPARPSMAFGGRRTQRKKGGVSDDPTRTEHPVDGWMQRAKPWAIHCTYRAYSISTPPVDTTCVQTGRVMSMSTPMSVYLQHLQVRLYVETSEVVLVVAIEAGFRVQEEHFRVCREKKGEETEQRRERKRMRTIKRGKTNRVGFSPAFCPPPPLLSHAVRRVNL